MLVEKTKRRAIYDLESQGFVVGNLIYVPYIGKDVVIEVKIGDRSVMPGEKLTKGTIIDLVLGQGLSDELILSPYTKIANDSLEFQLQTPLDSTLNDSVL